MAKNVIETPEGKFINADVLFSKIAGHSDYHGNDILTAITLMAEGKECSDVKPLIP
jgi:hypothetical protein